MKKKTFAGIALIVIAAVAGSVTEPSFGQAGTDDPLLTPLIAELVTQQAAVVENQTKIDAKIAVIAEDIRIARIYVGRGGGKATGK